MIMSKKIEVDLEEVQRVFALLEDLNALFHQPMKCKDSEYVSNFAKKNYPEIKDLYYEIVWNWLPKDVQEKIEEG